MFQVNLKLTIRPIFFKNENYFSHKVIPENSLYLLMMCVEQMQAAATPNSFKRSDHIVLGFPNRAHARLLVQSAPLYWHKSMAMCRSCCAHDTFRMTCVARGPTLTHSVRNVPARGGLCTSFSCARTIWGN